MLQKFGVVSTQGDIKLHKYQLVEQVINICALRTTKIKTYLIVLMIKIITRLKIIL